MSLHNEKTHNSGVSDQLSEEVQTFLDLMISMLSMRGIRAVFNNGTDTALKWLQQQFLGGSVCNLSQAH